MTEWKQMSETKTHPSGLYHRNLVVPSPSPLWNPHYRFSFLAVICTPPASPQHLPLFATRYLLSLYFLVFFFFGELFISLCMSLISTCSKIWQRGRGGGVGGDGSGDIDLSWQRTRQGVN